jgi:lipopolysaccharide heptosyltransferase II
VSSLTGRWADASRILVVRLDALGDVLMTTPAFRALAQSGPDVRLTLLTSPVGAAIAPLLPEIDDVIVHDVPWMKGGASTATAAAESTAGSAESTARSAESTAGSFASAPDVTDAWGASGADASGGNEGAGAADRRLIAELRERQFDAAVIFTVHTQSALPAALLCHLADIPLRLAHSRENPYRLLTDWVAEPEPDAPTRHETQRQLDLVATIGARVDDPHLSVRVPPDAARSIRSRLRAAGIGDDRPWAVIAPGASAASRRYPVGRFAAVARALVRDHGWRVVVTGSAAERTLAERVVAGLGDRATMFAGGVGLGDLVALLAAAPVVVANNSGTAHLAAAVGTPVVDLYALTNLQHAPWGVASRVLAHDVPCKGCRKSVCPFGHNACLATIEPDDVVAATVDLVERGGIPVSLPAGILPGVPAATTRPT